VLIKCLLEYALSSGAAELDFTIGEEEFKYRFANHTRRNCAARIYPSWLPYRMHTLLLAARAGVERSPWLTRLMRRLLWRWRSQAWM
jgi:CelD/BcsL family acetyltransferase involved in cellulose biosynthesis